MRTSIPFWILLAPVLIAWPMSNLFGQSGQNKIPVFDLDHLEDLDERKTSNSSTTGLQKQFSFASLTTEEKAWIKPISDSSESDRPVGIRDTFPLFDGDRSLTNLAPISDDSPSKGLLLFVDYDAFRGVSDGGWENNGIRTGFNFASRLGQFSDLTGVIRSAPEECGVNLKKDKQSRAMFGLAKSDLFKSGVPGACCWLPGRQSTEGTPPCRMLRESTDIWQSLFG